MNLFFSKIKELLRLYQFIWWILIYTNARAQEEFNGPFKSWANVKTRFGAKGDGKNDDTRSLQLALDSLSDWQVQFNIGPRGYAVVYLPAGKYKITSTLLLRGKIGVKIVGEDPEKTVILWQGPEKDTMFWANGSAYFSVSRMSWDRGGRKEMEAIGLHWQSVWRSPQNNSSAALNIEFLDLVFREGFFKGISGGTQYEGTNANDSEVLIKRCVFNKCTRAGVAIRGYNALDYWIWYCRFIQCAIGVECNSGNYHVYSSYFKQSLSADVMNTNCYYSSVRYCYSTGSALFSFDNGKSSNPFKRIFQENTIIDPKQNPIQYYHAGKITLIDNYCRVPVNSPVKAFLIYDTWAATNYTVLEVGNTLENFKNTYQMPVNNYKIYRGGSRRRALDSENAFLARIPSTPLWKKRTVYEVPPGAGTAIIQPILNKANALKNKAIVHFPFGRYYLDKALVLQKNSDIRIIGDGLIYASVLIPRKKGNTFENGSVFKIYGPSSVNVKDLDIQTVDNQVDKSRAILIFNADQPSSSCLIDQLYSVTDSTIVINGYDHLVVQKTNSFFSDGNYVKGGVGSQKKTSQLRMQCFGGQFAGTRVTNNAYFFASDCWWEGSSRIPLDLSGEGTFLVQGAMIAPRMADSNTTVRVNKFNGKIGLMDMYLQGGLEINPDNPLLKLMVWNIHFYHKRRPLLFLKKVGNFNSFFGGITSQCFETGDPACADILNTSDIEINIGNTAQFIEEFIQDLRITKPLEYTSQPASRSNLYFSRVSVSGAFSAAIVFDKVN